MSGFEFDVFLKDEGDFFFLGWQSAVGREWCESLDGWPECERRISVGRRQAYEAMNLAEQHGLEVAWL